jgi:DNA processing protein
LAGFEFVEKGDSRYPALLGMIPDPPERLYYRGDLCALSYPAIAVVGSRKSTEYGRWAAYTIAKRLSDHGVAVVSGMAEGIDTWAHKGALAAPAPTIAVFGSGLDFCYPAANRELMEDIAKSGLLLSEYAAGIRPSRFTFPRRNRIISGLCGATVVVEAGFSSGSLITAELAVDQGREIFAVPGNINRKTSVGCNKLIADGARPVVFIDDILTDLGIRPSAAKVLGGDLCGDEKRVVAIIAMNGEMSYDRLAAEAGLSIAALTSMVTLLEMKGQVSTAAGKVFLANP